MAVKAVATKLDEETRAALLKYCKDYDDNMSHILRRLIRQFLKAKGYLKK